MSEQIINSDQALESYIQHLRNQFRQHKYLRITDKTGKQRTSTQNASLHLYCKHLAIALNDGGFDFRETIKAGIDVPWTEHLVKEYMWRPVQKAVTGHKSSTKPETHQYGEIYEALNNHLSSKLGLFVAWPSKDSKDG